MYTNIQYVIKQRYLITDLKGTNANYALNALPAKTAL